MSEEPTIKISQAEYKALMNIALTAEQYLRTGSIEHGDELRDAVLLTKAFSEDEEFRQVRVTFPEVLHEWLRDEMYLIVEHSEMSDSERAKDVLEALQAGSHK